jgi:hypothetical protein
MSILRPYKKASGFIVSTCSTCRVLIFIVWELSNSAVFGSIQCASYASPISHRCGSRVIPVRHTPPGRRTPRRTTSLNVNPQKAAAPLRIVLALMDYIQFGAAPRM